jgi:hypothetical protein
MRLVVIDWYYEFTILEPGLTLRIIARLRPETIGPLNKTLATPQVPAGTFPHNVGSPLNFTNRSGHLIMRSPRENNACGVVFAQNHHVQALTKLILGLRICGAAQNLYGWYPAEQ